MTNGPGWTNNGGWGSAAGTECGWYGVTCTDNHVTTLNLNANNLTGVLPSSMNDLVQLEVLSLQDNSLSGPIPATLGDLSNLRILHLPNNTLSGSIPAVLGSLINLTELLLHDNLLTGTIPSSLGSLTQVQYLSLSSNQLSGPIPSELGGLSNLRSLLFYNNLLSGALPDTLGSLANLESLQIFNNNLSGQIPSTLGNLTNLTNLNLHNNQFIGAIPTELDQLTNLQYFTLQGNMLIGEIPASLASLTALINGETDFRWNGLYTADDTLRGFLNGKQTGGDWESFQTVAPSDPFATVLSDTQVQVSWTPIAYTADGGYYEICLATASGGDCSLTWFSGPKTVNTGFAEPVAPATTYFIKVRTITEPHPFNGNTVTSDWTSEVTVTTTGFVDADGDAMADDWEQQIIDFDLNDAITSINDVLPGDDFDNEGLNNIDEFINSTLPTAPDTDSDGFSDLHEIQAGTNPTIASVCPEHYAALCRRDRKRQEPRRRGPPLEDPAQSGIPCQ